YLDHHGHARRADGVALCLESAIHVHRDLSSNHGLAVLQEPDPLPLLTEAQVLISHYLGDREAIVTVRHVDHLWPYLGCRVCLARGVDRRAEPHITVPPAHVG